VSEVAGKVKKKKHRPWWQETLPLLVIAIVLAGYEIGVTLISRSGSAPPSSSAPDSSAPSSSPPGEATPPAEPAPS